MSVEKLLEQKKTVKAKKPVFRRQDSHKKKKLGTQWRRPRGFQNKVRLRKRGYLPYLQIGWGSPKLIKFHNAEGKLPVRIENNTQLAVLDPKKHSLILAASTGTKARQAILQEALQKKFSIENIDNPEAYIKDIEQSIKERKEERKKLKESRATKRAAARKEGEKAAKKQEEAEEKTEDDKKEEKKEYDKMLIQNE